VCAGLPGKTNCERGGDCPETPLKAILDLIHRYPRDLGCSAPLYLITDASSREEERNYTETVRKLSLGLKWGLNFITTGDLCGDGPDLFEYLSTSTAGMLHDLKKSSLSQFTEPINGQTKSRSTVKTIQISLPTRYRRQALSSYQSTSTLIIVDSTMTALLIVLSGKQGSLQVKDPSGKVYSNHSVKFISNLENVKAVKFNQRDFPDGWNGTWTAMATCRGRCHLVVETESPIDFSYNLVAIWRRAGRNVANYAPTLSTPMEGNIETTYGLHSY
jgi:hypothetical protein